MWNRMCMLKMNVFKANKETSEKNSTHFCKNLKSII